MGKNSSAGRVVVNSVIYTFSGLLLKCFSFFLLPLYTAYLTTKDYGITSIANSFISTMSFVVTFSLFSAVMRFYVDLKDSPEKLKRFYGTISLFSFLSGFSESFHKSRCTPCPFKNCSGLLFSLFCSANVCSSLKKSTLPTLSTR